MHSAFLIVPLAFVTGVIAQGGQTCNATSHCKSSNPCCSEFGFCGDEHFCLGGCNPLFSHDIDSCRPSPICQDQTYTFPDNTRILSNSTYFDGNSTEYDWVVDKGNIMNTNSSGGELALMLTEKNGGTRISSTKYVHYGTITAKLKTARTNGVVTAFITMSDVKDEIDWEFPGSKTTEGQTNFFWQGVIPSTSNGATHTGLTDTFSNYHDYSINWQQDALTFSIDGNIVRTVKASDMAGKYPTTPSRIQISIWPAGISSSAQGTIDWAGGMIPWDSDPDLKQTGHIAAVLSSVTVKCADPVNPKTAGANITSYIYSTNDTTPTIQLSNHSTLLNGVFSSVAAPSSIVLSSIFCLLLVLSSLTNL